MLDIWLSCAQMAGVEELSRLPRGPGHGFPHHGGRNGIIPRKQAKTINLGMMYGMGVNKLSDQLDIDVDEAKGQSGNTTTASRLLKD